MRSKQRIETTIETHEVWIIRQRANKSPVWCAKCPGQTPMFELEEAARLVSVSPRKIYRWIETGGLHFTETTDGRLLVCHASLLAGKLVADLTVDECDKASPLQHTWPPFLVLSY